MSGADSPDDYFNDLTRNNPESPPPDGLQVLRDLPENRGALKAKRIACVICRKRKLRCDGLKPSCGTCSRLGHKCAYDEVRRKSGPKRGYVKELEARLEQVEARLKKNNGGMHQAQATPRPRAPTSEFPLEGPTNGMPSVPVAMRKAVNVGPPGDFSWEMIGLGLDEPLPGRELMDELHQVYFDIIHPSLPMMHKYRYLAAMNLAPHMRPAVCLRYAMWALAASVTTKYMAYADVFYQRARKYIETDEMRGHGENYVTIGHSQCWTLLATYEFKSMYFPRAWMSSGRATRLAQMLGLQRVDSSGLEVKSTLPPPRDWTDREERRRTFWMAYCTDRYASVGTGWPVMNEEKDILSNLPAENDAYDSGKYQETCTLAQAFTSDGVASMSSMAGIALTASLFGHNLTHLHRASDDDMPEDLVNGEYWKRHWKLESTIEDILKALPTRLRISPTTKDPNVVFLNVNLHASIICLHQAAIMKAAKHGFDEIVASSSNRCFVAAAEIVEIMKSTEQTFMSTINPFLGFCLFVAARVFTSWHKKYPKGESVGTNLECLISSMQAHRQKNNLTESFLVQLGVELESAGLHRLLDISKQRYEPIRNPVEVYREARNYGSVFQGPASQHPYRDMHERVGDGPPIPFSTPQGGRIHRDSECYSAPSFEVPVRDRPPHLQNKPDQRGMQGVLLSQGWGPGSTGQNTGVPLNQFRPLNSDMSPEDASDRAGLSNHPTPSSSTHQASSHTSYSPGITDDRINERHSASAAAAAAAAPHVSTTAQQQTASFFQSHHPALPRQRQPHGHGHGEYDPFAAVTSAGGYTPQIPTSNEYNQSLMSDGTTQWGSATTAAAAAAAAVAAAAEADGMAAGLGDAGWDQILDSMNWTEESPIGPAPGMESGWRGLQQSNGTDHRHSSMKQY